MLTISLSIIKAAYLEPSSRRSGELLSYNHVMEVVKLFAIDSSVHDVSAMEMLAWAQAHGKYAVVRHFVDQLLTDLCNIQVS